MRPTPGTREHEKWVRDKHSRIIQEGNRMMKQDMEDDFGDRDLFYQSMYAVCKNKKPIEIQLANNGRKYYVYNVMGIRKHVPEDKCGYHVDERGIKIRKAYFHKV